jgi:hypothetical protein
VPVVIGLVGIVAVGSSLRRKQQVEVASEVELAEAA